MTTKNYNNAKEQNEWWQREALHIQTTTFTFSLTFTRSTYQADVNFHQLIKKGLLLGGETGESRHKNENETHCLSRGVESYSYHKIHIKKTLKCYCNIAWYCSHSKITRHNADLSDVIPNTSQAPFKPYLTTGTQIYEVQRGLDHDWHNTHTPPRVLYGLLGTWTARTGSTDANLLLGTAG